VLEEFKASLPALYSSGRQNGKSNGVWNWYKEIEWVQWCKHM
jgi:hypothetical protein